MELLKPKALKKGDTIGVFAPSGIAYEDQVEKAKQYMVDQKYKVKVHEQTFLQYGNLAGTDADKIKALHELFSDNTIDAIFCARGGNGLLQYIDQLDYDLIKNNPKPLVGFSDVTVLHHALLNKANLVSFHGPIFQYMRDDVSQSSSSCCINTLSGSYDYDLLAIASEQLENYSISIVQKGTAEGRLIGGNMTLMSELTKTSDFKPQFANNIVFLEDTEDYAYKHDRQLAGFFNNNEFKKAAAIIIGVSKIDPNESAGDFKHPRRTWSDIMQFYINKYNLDIPVVINAPITHGQPNQIIPQGVMAKLDATASKPTLTLLESPFAP